MVERLLHHQNSHSNINASQVEHYATMNSEYLKRRYRKKYENPEKIKELLAEQTVVVENLRTAVEGKMSAAVIGVLHGIIAELDSANYQQPDASTSKAIVDSGDRQRALYKANICATIDSVLRQLGGQPDVCEKAFTAIAYLCRYSDDNKLSVCLENAKAFAMLGICEMVIGGIKRHANDPMNHKKVMIAACDAIRCLCSLESNRERFSNAGASEICARALVKYASDPEAVCWICRAIGHLANNCDNNRDLLGQSGACQNIILALQRYPMNLNVCTEACWAIRQLALFEENRSSFSNDAAPESIMATYANHFKNEAFSTEATHAMANLIGSEDDPIIGRIAMSGFTSLALKSIKKNPDNDILPRWVFQTLYYLACDDKLGLKLVSSDILELLSVSLENHASNENMAEWGCRFVHKLIKFENASSKMRSAGMCEMITSAVQRQAISKVVSSVGCLAIGDLAKDEANQERLTQAGACDATVGALKRHNGSVDVAFNSCYAIHFLCKTSNNVSWMGASGACEAVTSALKKHQATSEEVARYASNALGSLAHRNDGNQMRLFNAGACAVVVDTLTTYAALAEVVENCSRAIYNLSGEPQNVSELGKCGACGLVVTALQSHPENKNVAAQALKAIYGLAVKTRIDKVHKGNTRKLVEKGAIESIVATMQKFQDQAPVQGAAGMAIWSLAKLEANRNKLGAVGACELVAHALQLHMGTPSVVSKLASAIDSLAMNSEANKAKFTGLQVIEYLLTALQKHEKSAIMITDCLRALINLSTVEANKKRVFNEPAFKLYVKLMKQHEKSSQVALWSCTMIYTASYNEANRILLGGSKACENVINVLAKHGGSDPEVAAWGCKAVVGLSLADSNKERFHNPESCNAMVKVLQNQNKEPVVAEWCTAAVVSIAVFPQNRIKLGSSGVCAALCATLTNQKNIEAIVRLGCEAVYELALEEQNQTAFKTAGILPIMIDLFNQHGTNAMIAAEICRAISSLSSNNPEIAAQFVDLGVTELLITGLKLHIFSAPFNQWACSSIAALCGKSPKNQTIFGELPTIEIISKVIRQHTTVAAVCAQSMRCIRTLSFNNKENSSRVAKSDIIPSCLGLMKAHVAVDVIVEHASWIVGNIEYKPVPQLSSTQSFKMSSENLLQDSASVPAQGESSKEESNKMSASAKEFYRDASNWDILYAALQQSAHKTIPLRWVCTAISMFAERGKLAHPNICDSLVSLLDKHIDNDQVVQKLLVAIGSLAHTNTENNARLSRANLCELVDNVLSVYIEGSLTIYGALPCIAGLAENQESNQNHFYSLPHVTSSIIKILYDELETEMVSQFGCAAISALVKNHPKNKAKFGPVCIYIADVVLTYKSHPNQLILIEGVKAISNLAHMSITNRNRLGASDACSAVMQAIQLHINEQMASSWRKVERTLIYWSTRAIADLAANNPNNQAKLGNYGACELLVKILQRKSVPGQSSSIQ